MDYREYVLKDGRSLLIREANRDDAGALLDYINTVSGESDFLTFGSGEFELSEAEEAAFLEQSRAADNQLYLLALVAGEIAGSLTFSAGRRARVRHSGDLGMSVRKAYWGLGVGENLLDALLAWVGRTGFVRKVNLSVRTDNVRAIKLYSRKGFVKEGKISRGIFLNGGFYDLYAMGLEL